MMPYDDQAPSFSDISALSDLQRIQQAQAAQAQQSLALGSLQGTPLGTAPSYDVGLAPQEQPGRLKALLSNFFANGALAARSYYGMDQLEESRARTQHLQQQTLALQQAARPVPLQPELSQALGLPPGATVPARLAEKLQEVMAQRALMPQKELSPEVQAYHHFLSNGMNPAQAYQATKELGVHKDVNRDDKAIAIMSKPKKQWTPEESNYMTGYLSWVQATKVQPAVDRYFETPHPGNLTPLVDAQGNVRAVFNNRTGEIRPIQQGAGDFRKTPLSAEEQDARAKMATMFGQFDRMEQLAKQNPNSLGPIAGRLGKLQAGTIGGSPAVADLNQVIQDVNNSIVYLLSGKQINENEGKRLKDAMPTVDLPFDTFMVRLNNVRSKLKEIQGRKVGAAAPAAGTEAPATHIWTPNGLQPVGGR